ncbi:WAT1-related protein At5g64700-like [Corylus avellana]|uniref:WAT1-related protein At5g64700-like n=1 Tax=Corylus avellana TaxID=13451 RepID=UPI00286D1405|nr:WAT1-related protein At5g64700-like [Corylus avellana]
MGVKKPYLAVILIQTIYAGMILLSKAVLSRGAMNSYVFMFYRQLVGTVFLVPLALIFERKNAERLSFVILCKIFMLAFLGITLALNIFCLGLVYTSATLGAATTNCLPVTTFFFAVLLRMEKVTIKTTPGIAKVVGLAVCMAGVATLAFYGGPQLNPSIHYPFLGNNHDMQQDHQAHASFGKTWILGCFLLFLSIVSWGLWLVLQAQVLKSYPSKLIFTSLQCLFSASQSFVVAIALERDPHQWKLGWNIRLFTVVYCGTLVTGVSYYLQAWVIEKKGPIFQAMSTPLNLIFTIIGSVFLLGEVIRLGSLLGGILLAVSLYSVLWGKSKEQSDDNGGTALQVQAEKECAELKETEVTSSEPSLFV